MRVSVFCNLCLPPTALIFKFQQKVRHRIQLQSLDERAIMAAASIPTVITATITEAITQWAIMWWTGSWR